LSPSPPAWREPCVTPPHPCARRVSPPWCSCADLLCSSPFLSLPCDSAVACYSLSPTPRQPPKIRAVACDCARLPVRAHVPPRDHLAALLQALVEPVARHALPLPSELLGLRARGD